MLTQYDNINGELDVEIIKTLPVKDVKLSVNLSCPKEESGIPRRLQEACDSVLGRYEHECSITDYAKNDLNPVCRAVFADDFLAYETELRGNINAMLQLEGQQMLRQKSERHLMDIHQFKESIVSLLDVKKHVLVKQLLMFVTKLKYLYHLSLNQLLSILEKEKVPAENELFHQPFSKLLMNSINCLFSASMFRDFTICLMEKGLLSSFRESTLAELLHGLNITTTAASDDKKKKVIWLPSICFYWR